MTQVKESGVDDRPTHELREFSGTSLKKRRSALSVALGLILVAASTPSLRALENPPTSPTASISDLVRYEPTGLSLPSPYARGKIPAVFIHGLLSNPSSWHRMIATLEDDPAIKEKYQFWTFGYSTGDPILYSSHLLRQSLDDARKKLDPDRTDAAFDRMVIVGHSMGGLLSKTMATDAGDRVWRVVSDRPYDEMLGDADDLELIRDSLFFGARPEVRRMIYIATPHGGSQLDRGPIQHFGTRLVRISDPLRAAHNRLVSRNKPTFFRDHFRKTIPSSINELELGSPILKALAELPSSKNVKVHSIIAVRKDSPKLGRTDGVVSYDSAHLEGVASEKVVTTSHLCQEHPEVMSEVKRILLEHESP